MGVALDLEQPGDLGEVQAEHRAADAGVFVLAGGAVGPVAGAERDLAQREVVAEVLPLDVAGFAVLLGGPLGAAQVDVLPVVPDDLLRVDGDVALGGVEVQVPEELGGDVNRQAGVDGLGGEDPAEVVPGERQRRPVDVDQAGPDREGLEHLANVLG